MVGGSIMRRSLIAAVTTWLLAGVLTGLVACLPVAVSGSDGGTGPDAGTGLDAGEGSDGGAACDGGGCTPCLVRACGPAIGTNLSGLEWARPGLRYGASTLPNLNFTVPRKADVAYLAANGFTKNRLPIQWELLQPMLHDTVADAAARAAIGEPGAFHPGYQAFITGVLDAHAAAGTKAIIDCHNYCRYQDFRYQGDGSVSGLTVPVDPLVRPYTSDGSQVQERICALASGATLTPANLADFWTRVARTWKDHPGFGGYGLMNEPHDLPAAGTTSSGGSEDQTIWPTFAQVAVDAIRAVDPVNPIYVSGNGWDSAMGLATSNPGYPLRGANLIYEVHVYLDASSSGYAFDYDTEVAKGYSAGFGGVPIDADTGRARLELATTWAKAHGVGLALTEIGMPLDDPRWQESFTRAVVFARQEGVEIYSWMGGSHWPIRNYALNQVPGWYQHTTLVPEVAGPLEQAAGLGLATLYDEGPGAAPASGPVTITLVARGFLAAPLTVDVHASAGTLSASSVTLPSGANSSASFTFSPPPDAVSTLSYSRAGGGQVPPPRKVFSLVDPVASAATSLSDAALAILAKYGASKWELADAFTDVELGHPSAEGDVIRAVADTGFGSSTTNAMEMLNWLNTDGPGEGRWVPPVLRTLGGKKSADLSAPGTLGLWCKKAVPIPGVQANPRNRVPYDLETPHFALAAIRAPAAGASGVIVQASRAEDVVTSELRLEGGTPVALWVDSGGQTVQLTASSALAPGATAVLTLTSAPGSQHLRVDAVDTGSASATFAPSPFNQLLIGSGFLSYYPRDGFGGNVFAVIAGRGTPSDAELRVLERFLAATAGLTL
jgi:hypothetical protein